MTDRHKAIADAERFADRARDAAEERRYARAAVLYWAAAMVLSGRSVPETTVLLVEFSTPAATTLRRAACLRPRSESSHPGRSDGSQPSF
jgi:hypothetical protein